MVELASAEQVSSPVWVYEEKKRDNQQVKLVGDWRRERRLRLRAARESENSRAVELALASFVLLLLGTGHRGVVGSLAPKGALRGLEPSPLCCACVGLRSLSDCSSSTLPRARLRTSDCESRWLTGGPLAAKQL